MTELLIDRIESAIGEIVIITDDNALCSLDFSDCEARMLKLFQKRYPSFSLIETSNPQGISDRICAYLSDPFHSLDDIPVKTGGTPFQQQVWLALRTIPPGTVLSYRKLAIQVGREKACRAVGAANSLNPIALVLPCHRVVGANLSLTGYAGGLERKQWLLKHEGVSLATLAPKKPTIPTLKQLKLLQ